MSRAVVISMLISILVFTCLAIGARLEDATRARRALYVVLIMLLTGFVNGFVRGAAQ